jgi:outer membrane protein assembly factor BamB
MPPVGSQGSSPSCTAWALCYYYKTYQEWLEHGWSVLDSAHQFSPAFAYNQACRGGTLGSYASDIMKVIVDQGCANLLDSPFDAPDHTTWPSETAYYHALPFRAQTACWIDCRNDAGILALKARLADGDNADLGFYVWGNFDNINNYDTVYCVADKTGSNRGGHHVCILGYDDGRATHDGPGAFRIVNSWGTGWGNRGYAWISYAAVKDAELSGQWVCYLTDRTAYSPTLTARYRATHAKREWVSLTAGMGSGWSKEFYNWQLDAQSGNPFPNHDVILDLSDGDTLLDPCDTNSIYIEMRDNLADGVTGSIDHLSALSTAWGAFSRAQDTLIPIPDNASPARMSLRLPTVPEHWQCAQHFPARTGLSGLTGDMDTAALKWAYNSGSRILTSPAIGDVNDDGRQEVIVCPLYAPVCALDGESGDTIWTRTLGSSNEAPPCLGDVDADGRLEVVTATFDGHVYALRGSSGSILWTYSAPDIGPTALCLNDVDGDGRLEVVFSTGTSSAVYALNAGDGSLLWRHPIPGGLYASAPAVADVNADGEPEVVVGSMDYNLYILEGTDGSVADTFASGGEIWYSPTIGDVNADGRKDIVFSATDNLMYAVDGGRDSLHWSCPSGGLDRPWFALGDVDGDGRPEVVSVLGGYARALNGEDGSTEWSFPALVAWSAPVIADVNGDGALEVVFGDDDCSVCALRGSDGTLLWSFPIDGYASEPALGDIDSDGQVEVVVGCYEGWLYALDGSLSGARESPTGRELLRLSLSPNPASGSATIRYSLPAASAVRIALYDCAGRLVRTLVDGYRPAGSYSYTLLTAHHSLAGGVYFCRLVADASCVDRKLTITR